ncbi:MAG TPA: glycosyltransferase family 2 protein, partial [Baekduia sp.]|nr:glycosyltransferase family 2 protein [Baekduia sp.]
MSVVSVVSPFHNTAKYLPECIESVLAQTYRDFEYLLVDNCSTDGSGEVAERYARRDPRLRVIRSEPLLPQVPNYSRALTYISPDSRWCKVVQADDALFPRCLEEMVALGEAHPSIGVVSAYRLNGRGVLPPEGPPHTKTFMTGREACRMMLVDDIYLFGSPTTLMVRSDIVRSRVPFYTDGRYYEDAEAIYEILRDHDFGFVYQILSFSRMEADSIWGQMRGYQPMVLSRLTQLKRYGHDYLSPEEYRLYVGAQEETYRRMLAGAMLRRRE